MTTDGDFAQHPADSEWHRRLTFGERPDGSWMTQGPAHAYESVVMRPLEPMFVPEKPRHGELDPQNCGSCAPSEHTIWADEHWLLEDAPLEVMAALGPLMQRISEAVKTIPGVARCHFSRWNDGSAHLHLWAFARPAGMMQGRGAVLSYWDGMLPEMSEEMMNEYVGIVAQRLAAGGGEAFPHRAV